jgi:acetoin utilization protein AcuC
MTVDGQRATYAALHRLAHEVCGGRWVALGGGGYEPVQVVPRAWTHLLAEVTGAQLGADTPDDWQAEATERGGEQAPSSLSDGGSGGYAPYGWEGLDWSDRAPDRLDRLVDEAIAATREATFAPLDLDPDVD